MSPDRAYSLGWKASARPGHDLERDEARFIDRHGRDAWRYWCEGWEDYALGHDYGASVAHRHP